MDSPVPIVAAGALYWRDRNLKFHLYDLVAPTSNVEALLDELLAASAAEVRRVPRGDLEGLLAEMLDLPAPSGGP